jgi:bile acid:Na+ symporter, BASS family
LARRDGLTIATELGIKNGTLGMLVAMTLLGDTEMAVPSAVYGILMYLFGFGLIYYGRRLHASVPSPA